MGDGRYDTNDDPAEHDCAAIEEELAYARVEIAALRPLVKLSIPILEMADAWFRKAFDYSCDHGEDCDCSRRSMARVALDDFRKAWKRAHEESLGKEVSDG